MEPGKQTQQTSYMQKDLQQNHKKQKQTNKQTNNPERIGCILADQRAPLTETTQQWPKNRHVDQQDTVENPETKYITKPP